MPVRPPVALPVVVALAVAAGAVGAPAAPAAGWRAPVDGPVVGRFHVGADPFSPGQRRGVDLAAAPGAPVRAPCGGAVTFAGRLPGRAGVTIRCGPLVATVLGLAGLEVAHGDAVARGRRLGVVAAGGRVRLGARRAGDPFGYRDPLALIAADGAPGPGPPAPAARRAPRGPRSGPPGRPGAAPRAQPAAVPRIVPAAAPTGAPARAPLLAWAGVALAAIGLPAGALGVRVRIRRHAPATGAVAAPE